MIDAFFSELGLVFNKERLEGEVVGRSANSNSTSGKEEKVAKGGKPKSFVHPIISA